MSKHLNKYWIREKEFISLTMEHSLLWDRLPRSSFKLIESTRYIEIESKLIHKFYNEYHGRSAPKWFRKSLNRRNRYKSKKILYRVVKTKQDYISEDNHKDAYWRFW